MNCSQLVFIHGGLTYFAPLMQEAKKRGLPVSWIPPLHANIALPDSHSYSGEQRRCLDQAFAKENGIQVRNQQWVQAQSEGVFLVCEGTNSKWVQRNSGTTILSLTVMTDFRRLYCKYIDNVDWVILPNRKFATYYNPSSRCNLETNKNLYFGSPKYDIPIDDGTVYAKHGLPKEAKIAAVFMPKLRDVARVNLAAVFRELKQRGYYIVTKTRSKDPHSSLRGDKHVETTFYYPNTSMEIMSVAKVVINFDSTLVKEAVMMETPIINFSVKQHVRPLHFLYDGCCSVNLKAPFDYIAFGHHLDRIENADLHSEFGIIKKAYLFEAGMVSNRILEFITK